MTLNYDPAALEPDHWPWFLLGYQHGKAHGRLVGLSEAEDAHRNTWPVSAAVARQVAEAGPFADLCDRREEHEAAQEVRGLLAARGIWPPVDEVAS